MTEKYLCSAYIFYKWNEEDTFDNVLEKVERGVKDKNSNYETIHTEVSFYSNKVILSKTEGPLSKELSYMDFIKMMNSGEKIEGKLYDWDIVN
tara:strand:+ start:21 stop:299 length:279 start_codon:yes stop_codon:yes gene_type:complete